MNFSRCVAVLVAAAVLTVVVPVAAQVSPAPAPGAVPPPGAPPPDAPPPGAPPPTAPLPQDLLDSLLAPIALYPDQLLTQVLMASTYPLEVVQAARFVKDNPNLKGPALDDALKDKNWDASVLSLTAFPQVLDMMNDKLEWTQRLGDAFLNDEAGVMRTVQSLRWKAQQAGNLQSTEQQQVVVQEKTIIIQPAQPQYVYVPVYNPTVIYGPWWAPAYTPWFWYPPPIWGYPPYRVGVVSVGFYWGPRYAVTVNNWGWCQPNWHGGSVNINITKNNVWVNRPQYAHYQTNGSWNHNVAHRQGVAYRDTATANKYRPSSTAGVQTRENYRGRDNVTTRPASGSASNAARPSPGTLDRPASGGGASAARPAPGTLERPASGGGGNAARPSPGTLERPASGGSGNAARPSTGTLERPATGGGGGNAARPAPATPASRPAPSASRPAPAYQPESRSQVQQAANRGAQSRATAQRPAAPSGNRGGGGAGGGARGGQGRGG